MSIDYEGGGITAAVRKFPRADAARPANYTFNVHMADFNAGKPEAGKFIGVLKLPKGYVLTKVGVAIFSPLSDGTGGPPADTGGGAVPNLSGTYSIGQLQGPDFDATPPEGYKSDGAKARVGVAIGEEISDAGVISAGTANQINGSSYFQGAAEAANPAAAGAAAIQGNGSLGRGFLTGDVLAHPRDLSHLICPPLRQANEEVALGLLVNVAATDDANGVAETAVIRFNAEYAQTQMPE